MKVIECMHKGTKQCTYTYITNNYNNTAKVSFFQLTDYRDIIGVLHSPYLRSVRLGILKRLHVVNSKDTEEALPCPHILVPHGTVQEERKK